MRKILATAKTARKLLKADLEAGSVLYRQIAERIWNLDDLLKGGQP